MNNNKQKRFNFEERKEKINIIKTKESKNLNVQLLAVQFCTYKSQVNLNI